MSVSKPTYTPSYEGEPEPSKYTGTVLSRITAAVDRASPAATFNCDTCEKLAATEEVITSPILPCSRFCSTSCRDEAELAAENARHI